MQEITLGSLFDGIGGFPYAASFYGIHPLWASEIVPSCVSVTKKFFPDMAHVGDVTRLDGAKLGGHHYIWKSLPGVITGGPAPGTGGRAERSFFRGYPHHF